MSASQHGQLLLRSVQRAPAPMTTERACLVQGGGALRILAGAGGGACQVAIRLVVLVRESRGRPAWQPDRPSPGGSQLLHRLLASRGFPGPPDAPRGSRRRGRRRRGSRDRSRRIDGWPAFTCWLSPARICANESGHVRRNRGDITPGVGVVGPFDEAPDSPIVSRAYRATPSAMTPPGSPHTPAILDALSSPRWLGLCVRRRWRSSRSPHVRYLFAGSQEERTYAYMAQIEVREVRSALAGMSCQPAAAASVLWEGRSPQP